MTAQNKTNAVNNTEANVAHYIDYSVAPLPMTAWPIPQEQWSAFVDADALITFTAAVPLETLVVEGSEGLDEYVNQAFGPEVDVSHCEYRVVGHQDSTSFDDKFCGDVVVQVTCQLLSR